MVITNGFSLQDNIVNVTNIAAYLYDGTILYARAIDRMLKNGDNIRDAALVVEYMTNTSFYGTNLICYSTDSLIRFNAI